ncbi:MAG: FAD-dependent oxidoreductase [Gammaproteobacteria bacterium]|nr:FAD-dependent oxidoreductase [Gammaproteobacteria bacterium]
MQQADIVIIGAGHAGYQLVKEIRKITASRSILLLCADSGDYYSKPLLSNGFSKGKTAQALVQKTAAEMATEYQIQLQTHCVVESIDTEQKLLQTRLGQISYQQLVLATGASALTPQLPTAALAISQPINDLADYQRFLQRCEGKKDICILGAGLVGIEYANDLVNAGFQVSVIALEQQPLAQLMPAPLGDKLAQALMQLGVTFYWGNPITDAQASGEHCILTLADGRTLSTELILSAIGLKPNTELAKKSALVCGKGIRVDQYLRSSNADIYAIGDCAEICQHVLMYITPINLSAKALAATLCGQPTQLQLPAMPVLVKSPALPIVSCQNRQPDHTEWHISGEGMDWQALWFDQQQKLQAFALTGKMVGQRMRLIKQMTDLLPAAG